VILLSFNVALGGLEVTPYEFVRETEERLVLCMGQPGLQICISLKAWGNTRRRWLSALSLIVVSSAAMMVGARNAVLEECQTTKERLLQNIHLPVTTQWWGKLRDINLGDVLPPVAIHFGSHHLTECKH
jgi:hypothetical protein